jgi:GT2 family glycosyltransferase
VTEPRLSVVIAWANRPELAHTLVANAPVFAEADAEVIVASCGGNAEVLAGCVARAESPRVRSVSIDAPFNKALAINVGAHHARAEALFFLDSDLVLGAGTCRQALSRVSENCAVTLDRVVESAPEARLDYPHLRAIVNTFEIETDDGRCVRIETNRRRLDDGSRSAPGMVFVRKSCFEQVGGMNSDLTGWGWEDLDLLLRLQLCLALRIERIGTATHLTHGDDRRCIDGTSRALNEARNASLCMANYGLGHYLGTYDDDVSTWP